MEYTYNIDGLRESKTVNNIKTRYVYDGANILGEITEENIYTYTRGTELIGYTSNSGDRLYYVQDGHGNVTALLNEDGTEKKTYSYNPYGKEEDTIIYPMGSKTAIMLWRLQVETPHNPFRYCGEYYDDETDLIYLRNRYYDNTTGRFITEDPIQDGLNWYSYCDNDPINNIDPLGLFDYDDRISVSRNYSTDVKVLQNELAWLGYYSGDIDGYFGQKTLEAVNAYKNATGLGNTGKDKGVVGKQTWESLGLIYRTQKDIDAGVKIVTSGLKQYFDVTIPVTNAVEGAKSEFKNHKLEADWFIGQVKNQGKWNVKRNAQVWSDTLKISTNSYNKTLFFYGRLVVIDDIGNITYGYLGSVAGFSASVLKGGSLGYHILNHGMTEFKNEFSDQRYVQLGVDWYNGKDIQVRFGAP